MAKFLGWQICNQNGVNIQGDEDDPLQLASFEVIHRDDAARVAVLLEHEPVAWRLMPIYDTDIEEPKIVRFL